MKKIHALKRKMFFVNDFYFFAFFHKCLFLRQLANHSVSSHCCEVFFVQKIVNGVLVFVRVTLEV